MIILLSSYFLGAYFVYTRLKELCGGKDRADERLNDEMILPSEHSFTSSYSSKNFSGTMKYCDDSKRKEKLNVTSCNYADDCYNNNNSNNNSYDNNNNNNDNNNSNNDNDNNNNNNNDNNNNYNNNNDNNNNNNNNQNVNNNQNNDFKNNINSRTKHLIDSLQGMQISHDMTDLEKNEKKILAILWVSNLDERDCLLLLKMYLTSLSARDCSVLISMQRVKSVSNLPLSTFKSSSSSLSSDIPVPVPVPIYDVDIISSALPTNYCPEFSSSSSAFSPSTSSLHLSAKEWKTLCAQSSVAAGIVCKNRETRGNSSNYRKCESNFVDEVNNASRCNEDNGQYEDPIEEDVGFTFIAYTIGIVDIGLKPVSKIESKMILEDQICSKALLGNQSIME